MLCYIFFNYSYILSGAPDHTMRALFSGVGWRLETGDTNPPLVWCALEELVKQQALLLLGLSELKKGKALLLGHGDARPNLPFVQEERLDEVVDVVGPLQLQRVPCVLDDL